MERSIKSNWSGLFRGLRMGIGLIWRKLRPATKSNTIIVRRDKSNNSKINKKDNNTAYNKTKEKANN